MIQPDDLPVKGKSSTTEKSLSESNEVLEPLDDSGKGSSGESSTLLHDSSDHHSHTVLRHGFSNDVSQSLENNSPDSDTSLHGYSNEESKSLPIATKSQMAIINYPVVPNEILAIVAGPGSGKTFTVASRVANLIKEGKLLPEEILVLTMTNRAVSSFKSNLTKLVGEETTSKISISTFHSFCANLCDTYSSLYSETTSSKKRLLDDLSWRNFATFFSGKLVGINGKKLNTKISAPALERVLDGIRSGSISVESAASKNNISKEYIEELMSYLDKHGIVRYSHFITDALALMECSSKSQYIPQLARYKAVVVDEFQDMHYSLLSLVKKIVSYPTYSKEQEQSEITFESSSEPKPQSLGPQNVFKHLTIAGDPHQCIYEFLGSDPNLMVHLSKTFPDCKITELEIEETFRLTPEILLAAREVALRPNGLIDESSAPRFSTKPSMYPPIMNDFGSIHDELDFIGREVTRLILESGGVLKPQDFIVLGRTNKEIIQAETTLTTNFGIKCNRFSSSSNWVNSKVHLFLDLISVLTRAAGADFSLLCCLMLLDKRIGSKSRVSKLFNAFSESGAADLETYLTIELETVHAKRPKQISSLKAIYKPSENSAALERIKTFLEAIALERKSLESETPLSSPTPILSSLLQIVTKSGLIEYLNAPENSKADASLFTRIHDHKVSLETNLSSFNATLNSCFESYSKLSDKLPSDKFLDYFLRKFNEDIPVMHEECVNVSTIHSAKGLEFPVVFILGCNSDFVPQGHWHTVAYGIPNAQKARLFYVACTRAKNLLYYGNRGRYSNLEMLAERFFTCELPELDSIKSSQTIVSEIARDLGRKMAPSGKIAKGAELYRHWFPDHRVKVQSYAHRRGPPKIFNHPEPIKSFRRSMSIFKYRRF